MFSSFILRKLVIETTGGFLDKLLGCKGFGDRWTIGFMVVSPLLLLKF